MASKQVEAHRAAHENWERREFDALVADMVEDFTYEDHSRGLSMGSRDEFVDYVTAWAESFPDGTITEGAAYHDAGDTSVAEFILEGTNDGPFGPFPATGRHVSVPLCEIMNFDSEGQMVSGGIYYDQMSMLVQLGHAEPTEG